MTLPTSNQLCLIGNTQLHVQVIGELAKAVEQELPVLVFLHEALGSIAQWRDFPLQLSQAVSMPAIVYERQGFGKSAPRQSLPTKNYLHTEAFEVLPQLVDHFQLSKIILVGHSDGASIALLHAARFPKKVVGLITESAHVNVEPETLEGIQKMVGIYKEKIRPRLEQYHGAQTDTVFEAWYKTWLDPDFADWNIEEYLHDIEADTLVIQGKEDEYATILQMDAISNQLGGSVETWWIANCGHTPHRTYPKEVLARMSEFINELV